MTETLLIIAEQALMHFPLILGAYISMSLMKLPDLSLESAYVFGAFIACKTIPFLTQIPSFFSLTVVICISFIAGSCVGIISGFLNQKKGIPYLLSSIITIGIFHGITQAVAGVYYSLSNVTNLLEYNYIPLHPELPILLVIGGIITGISYYFLRTELGYSFAVFGANPSFFSHYGISTVYIGLVGTFIASGLAGISGYLCAQSNGFADISMGFGKVLLCITALILGKVMIKNNISVLIPISGLFGYFALQQVLLKIGFDSRYFTMVQALFIVCILIAAHNQKKESHSLDHLGI